MKRKLLPIIILLAVIAALASCAKTGAEQSARTDDGKIVLTLVTCSGQREEWDKLLKTAVSSYNDQASEYRIEIHDYGTLNDTPESDTGTGANMAPRLRVGMSVNSKEKAGVWDFMEYLLGDSFQAKSGGVRIRRDVMEPILKAQIEASVGVKKELGIFCKDDQGNVVEMRAPFQPLPQSAEAEIWAYIDQIDGTNEYDDTVLEIIQQEAAKYYDGYCTPKDAAERMQNRVSLYLAEQA